MPIILEFNTTTKDNTHTHFPYKSFIYIFYVIISTACERYQRKYRYLHTRLLRNEDDNDETSCVFEKSLLLFFWSVEAADICTAGVCSVLLLLFYTLKGRRFFFFPFPCRNVSDSSCEVSVTDDSSMWLRQCLITSFPFFCSSPSSSSSHWNWWMKRCKLVRFKQD